MSKTYNASQGAVRGAVIEALKMRGYSYSWTGDLIFGIKKIEYSPNSEWSAFGKEDKKIKIQVHATQLSSSERVINYRIRLTRLKLNLMVQVKDANSDWNTVNIIKDNDNEYFQKLIKDIDKKISIKRL